MDAGFFDKIKKSSRARIIPAEDAKIGTLRIPQGIPGEACISDEAPFGHPRTCFGRLLQVFIACIHIERVFYISLPGRIVMELRFDADALAVFFHQDVNLMRRTTADKSYIGPDTPAMSFKYFREESFKRKTRWTECKYGAFHRIPGGDRFRFLLTKHLESVMIYFFSHDAGMQLSKNMREDFGAHSRRCPGVRERMLEFSRIEGF